ncbi:hypothetical protein Plhal304r1_c007g0029111 [Plasmopara halstedii]
MCKPPGQNGGTAVQISGASESLTCISDKISEASLQNKSDLPVVIAQDIDEEDNENDN